MCDSPPTTTGGAICNEQTAGQPGVYECRCARITTTPPGNIDINTITTSPGTNNFESDDDTIDAEVLAVCVESTGTFLVTPLEDTTTPTDEPFATGVQTIGCIPADD